MGNHPQKHSHKLVDLHLLGVRIEFLEGLIYFDPIEVGKKELIVIFGEQVTIFLREADHIGNDLIDEVGGMMVFFCFHIV